MIDYHPSMAIHKSRKVSETRYLNINEPFELECGRSLTELVIAYCTYGKLNEKKDNVIWICHALTANADVADWWSGLVGKNKIFDPERYFIVCANMIGSCYGTTGPTSVNPLTNQPYGKVFPLVTIRDMVRAHQLLKKHLDIEKIHLVIGGSMGGQQALEWCISQPDAFEHLCVLASNAHHSPWGIAFNEAQRMALMADPTFPDHPDGGHNGLEAARAIAMLSYRSYYTYQNTQAEVDHSLLDDFKASSYQRYQGLKLRKRFNAHAYYTLSKAMDSHNVGRKRKSIEAALQAIKAKSLIIGITSDVLFPLSEQEFLAEHIPNASYAAIDSHYGHDGFLVEDRKISRLVQTFLLKGTLNDSGSFNPFEGIPKLDPKKIPGSESF